MPPKSKKAAGTEDHAALAEKYKKMDLREQIYALPEMYIGNIEKEPVEMFVLDAAGQEMKKRIITYVPGLYKLYDELIVNAEDQATRLLGTETAVKSIQVTIDRESGWISVHNDGNGIDVAMHPEHAMYIPEMIFGNLLTSTNYKAGEEKTVGGRHGLGAKLCNIFSQEFIVETVDHVRMLHYTQKFHANMTKKEEPKIKPAKAGAKPFTTIKFLPDYKRFGLDGLTDDLYELFRKRAYDVCACTDASVSVSFNKTKLSIKTFERYVDLYLGPKSERPRVYEQLNARWEVVASFNEGDGFEQCSFVNGIATTRGGRHVNAVADQIARYMVELAKTKKKRDIKPSTVKNYLTLFVKCVIVNPAFDTQTKEVLTTSPDKFGSSCILSDKFLATLGKSGFLEKVVEIAELVDQKKLKKTDGQKRSKILVEKLDDANDAGTKDSHLCTLILTEGDSAKTMAVSGLSIVGRNRYGIFPLRGKMLNVKDAATKVIADNKEITALKKILGLEQGKTYTDLSKLRYGKIMALTDSDTDGSHIKGLLFNVFQSLWPSLFRFPEFLTSMLTPIVKVSKGKVSQSFYSEQDFHNWLKTAPAAGGKGWNIKYYKGLGTSTAAEAKEYFKEMKQVTYDYSGEASDEAMNLAFDKTRPDDRKKWIMNWDKTVLDFKKPRVPFEDFIHRDLIQFSIDDIKRSIPNMCDGEKPSTRKILYCCFKKKLYSTPQDEKEIKVAQLSGYVSENADYHHGEVSLQMAIVGMAQNFVGSNNINLLQPNGQFGTRIQGGKDAASARYIFTVLNPLTKKLYRDEDAPIYDYIDSDGMRVEPTFYLPIMPLVLVNGAAGIGTGFSTTVPSFNPTDICASLVKLIDKFNRQGLKPELEHELNAIDDLIDETELPELSPWYHGFKGKIEQVEKAGKKTWFSCGVYRLLESKKAVEVTELPLGLWTEDYKDFLEDSIQNATNPYIRDFENHYTDKVVNFIIKMNGDKWEAFKADHEAIMERDFKMRAASKMLSMSNMHLFNEYGTIEYFETANDILKAFAKVRMHHYWKRKQFQMKDLKEQITVISAKVKFILEIISGSLNIMNRPIKDLEKELGTKGYPLSPQDQSYAYLTQLPISQLTKERKEDLEDKLKMLDEELEALELTSLQTIWYTEIRDFLEAWKLVA